MKKTNLRPFIIISAVLAGVFLLFFFSNAEVQAENEISVETSWYSVLGPSSFVFGGYYSGNVAQKGFTTYFEYKKNDQDLDNDPDTTIEIKRDDDADEANDFYTSPELNVLSTYYFRAVGYLNDNPSQKFYGSVLSIDTGNYPFNAIAPFAFRGGDGVIINYMPEGCSFASDLNNNCKSVDTDTTPPITCEAPLVYNYLYNKCLNPSTVIPPDTSTITCPDPENQRLVNGVCIGSEDNPAIDTPDSTTDYKGIVPCTENCGWKQFMELVNNFINFLLFYMAVPFAAIMFAYAGFTLVTSGGSTEKRGTAKTVFSNAVIGLIIAAGAWLIVKTILVILGYDGGWIGF